MLFASCCDGSELRDLAADPFDAIAPARDCSVEFGHRIVAREGFDLGFSPPWLPARRTAHSCRRRHRRADTGPARGCRSGSVRSCRPGPDPGSGAAARAARARQRLRRHVRSGVPDRGKHAREVVLRDVQHGNIAQGWQHIQPKRTPSVTRHTDVLQFSVSRLKRRPAITAASCLSTAPPGQAAPAPGSGRGHGQPPRGLDPPDRGPASGQWAAARRGPCRSGSGDR